MNLRSRCHVLKAKHNYKIICNHRKSAKGLSFYVQTFKEISQFFSSFIALKLEISYAYYKLPKFYD